MFRDHSSAIETFRNNREAALASPDVAHFGERIGQDLSRYAGGWLEFSLRTFKAHPDAYTWKPLMVPEAKTFADLFDFARFEPNDIGNQQTREVGQRIRDSMFGPGLMYVSTLGLKGKGRCGHIGGDRTLRHFPNGDMVRGRFGKARFHAAYARPTEAVKAPWRMVNGPDHVPAGDDGFGCLSSFEIVSREDGLLVIAHDGTSICRQWIALLPHSEAEGLFDLMPEIDRDMIETESKEEAAFAARLDRDEDGKPYIRDARAELVTVCGETYWNAEYRHDGTWFAVLNGNGGSPKYQSKGEALNGAAIALGFKVHR